MDRVVAAGSNEDGSKGFPGAFYLDAVGPNGTLRTGTQLLSASRGAVMSAPPKRHVTSPPTTSRTAAATAEHSSRQPFS